MTGAASGAADRVFVEAPARLHFGLLDLRGSLGRKFGGMGAAVPTPSVLVEATLADRIDCVGPEAERACGFAERFLSAHRVAAGARLRVHRAIPAHAGLGSGTQLALAVARALAELYGLPTDVTLLAEDVGRARRSAIGTWAFALGGFILEGGRRDRGGAAAPLLVRLPIPESWRCVVATPPRMTPPVSGAAEDAAFASLDPPPAAEVERVAHLVLMGVLPSLVEGDIVTFGDALSEVQRVTGHWFARIQGGTFAPGRSGDLIDRMREWGAAGVGQSSWGPTVYGIVAGAEAGAELAARVRAFMGDAGPVYEGEFASRGAQIWRE